MQFLQVDVFAGAAYGGNPLAVFPEADELSRQQMQAIARELNLSETSFVTRRARDSYDVRIFSPTEELAFAGHPTIGTAWVLQRLGMLDHDEVVQHSSAGETVVTRRDDVLWFARTGGVEADLEERDRNAGREVAAALGLEERDVGLEARELGRPGRIRPAYADAGVVHLLVPLRDPSVLGRISPRPETLLGLKAIGAYCFTAAGAGRVRARAFLPSIGVPEDPATGSAAAALGLFLDARLGAIDFEILQGVEMGRPSTIRVRAAGARAEVGGRCTLVFEGVLRALP